MNRRRKPNDNGKVSKSAAPSGSNGRRRPNGSSKRAAPPPADGSNGDNPRQETSRTHLTPVELEAFREQLLRKRSEVSGDLGHMEREALRKNRSDAAGDLSLMPIHMADIGTDNYEQEFTIGLMENERDLIKDIDAALKRIENGTYGICEATQKRISKARLKVRPWARFCIEYKRSQERNGRR